jgi:hypothetical protein
MPLHTTHTRDAALRQLHRINRCLIAGSVVLTGVFAEAAAHAFPGRTTKTTSASKVKRSGTHTIAPSKTTPHSLQPPAHPPQATTESSSVPDSTVPPQETPAASPRSAPASEPAPAQESAPPHGSAPAQESTPAREAAPTHESPPAEASAPVVSGGSWDVRDRDTRRSGLLHVAGARHERRAAHDHPRGDRRGTRGGRTGACRDRPRVQRFRADSELSAVNARAGRWTRVCSRWRLAGEGD